MLLMRILKALWGLDGTRDGGGTEPITKKLRNACGTYA